VRALAVVLCAVVIPATACADQFDLVCSLVTSVHGGRAAPSGDVHFRLDTSRNYFCVNDCNDVIAIQAVTPDKIITSNGSTDGFYVYSAYFDRADGTYHLTKLGPRGAPILQSDGPCRKEPFSGFPAAKF
jgi:hypothetical protein